MNNLGKTIRKNRRDKNLSQKKLGEKIGVSANSIRAWEQELNLPRLTHLQKLVKILNIPICLSLKEEKVMKLKLMNSAMMPTQGTYTLEKITPDEAVGRFLAFQGEWESFVGYPNNAKLLSILLGIDIPLSRAETHFEDGDEALVMKMKYRVDPSQKNKNEIGVSLDEYEFYWVRYTAK